MKQADLGLNLTTKRTRKREFLAEMERVVPWANLVGLITPYAPEGKGRKDRLLPVSERALHWLQEYLTRARPQLAWDLREKGVFLAHDGTPLGMSWVASRCCGGVLPGVVPGF